MTYHVIVMDMPQFLHINVSGEEEDYYSGYEALMINIDYADSLDQYEGRHIAFSIDPVNTSWSSSSDSPFGQPFTSDINILY